MKTEPGTKPRLFQVIMIFLRKDFMSLFNGT